MNIEIPDQEAKTILAGLRSSDPEVIARLADLLEKQVRTREEYPFTVYIYEESQGSYRSLEAIQEEFGPEQWDDEAREHMEVYKDGVLLDTSKLWAEKEPPAPPPDPYADWTNERWHSAYMTAESPTKQAEVRYNAQERGVDITDWPVAAELRARFREATAAGLYYRRYTLRAEAQALKVSTEDWDHPDTPPEDTEQEHRQALLAELEKSGLLPTMGGYCQVLISFAERAKALQAGDLERAFRAVASYWLKNSTRDREWFLADLPKVIALEEYQYKRSLSLYYLARLEVVRCMVRLLTRHVQAPTRAPEEGRSTQE